MKKIEGNKLVAVLLSAAMVTVVLAACTVDYDKLNKGINDLGKALDGNSTVATSATVSEADTSAPMSTTDESETEETTPVPTGTATPSATPTPTEVPAAERVDFSEYTDNIVADDFTVTTEEFEESSHSEEDDEVLFATFAGTRMASTFFLFSSFMASSPSLTCLSINSSKSAWSSLSTQPSTISRSSAKYIALVFLTAFSII